MNKALAQTSAGDTPISYMLHRKCSCGGHTLAGGECAECARKKNKLQRKLRIGSVNDPLEHEADRVADQVMRGAGSTVSPTPPVIQRMGYTGGDLEGEAPDSVTQTLAGSGRAMDAGLRQDMETRFGRDFSSVRVHQGGLAERSAREVNARAYTVGNNVVFGAGEYAPGSQSGQRLIAHELAHVSQQRESSARIQRHPAIVGMDRAGPKADLADNKFAPGTGDLRKDLEAAIKLAEWKEIRKVAYPKESARGIERAKDRKKGLIPELTGLGRIKTLDHLAAQMRRLQKDWVSFSTSDERLKEIWNIANGELRDAKVAEFKNIQKVKTEFKGYFSSATWMYSVSELLVGGGMLSEKDAGELANATLHESRHAEQHFLAARFDAGMNGKNESQISRDHGIPVDIAKKAKDKKLTKASDKATIALASKMFDAMVTDGAKNQRISNDDGLKELAEIRTKATGALNDLRAKTDAGTIASAQAQLGNLKKQISEVERLYTLYRNIPYEADAHEVGDAEEQAFKGWK